MSEDVVPPAYDGPTTIYLQWYEYVDGVYEDCIAWCQDKINDSDVEFVTAAQLQAANERIDELELLYEPYREIDKTISQLNENDPKWLTKLVSMCTSILASHLVESGIENQFSLAIERDGRDIEIVTRYVDGKSMTRRINELEQAARAVLAEHTENSASLARLEAVVADNGQGVCALCSKPKQYSEMGMCHGCWVKAAMEKQWGPTPASAADEQSEGQTGSYEFWDNEADGHYDGCG